MASSSSSRTQDVEHSALSRSILVDIEAEESDALDDELSESDDETTAAERARQAAESVPLRRHDHVDGVLLVANAWEKFAVEHDQRMHDGNVERPSRKSGKRKADPPAVPSLPRKRARAKSPSPPPNTFREKVQTAKGTYVIYLPEIPGENELQRQTRIYDASEPIIAAVDQEVVAEMIANRRSAPAASGANPTPQQSVPAHSSSISTAPAAPIDEEWTGGAPTLTSAPTPRPRSPPASRARSTSPVLPNDMIVDRQSPSDSSPSPSNDMSIDEQRHTPQVSSFDPRIIQGWTIVKRMLTDPELSLPKAREQVQKLFGGEPEKDIWAMLNKINDLDPDQFEETKSAIDKEVEDRLALAKDADVEIQSPSANVTVEEGQSEEARRRSARLEAQLQEQQLLARWVTGDSNPAVNPPDYQVFSVACRRGSELDTFDKISADIEAGRVHASVLRCVFKSRYPGRIYIQAYSMLPKHTKLAGYLRTVPGLLYRHLFKTSFPNENAWSQRNQKVKRQPPPVLKAHDLAMPIHMRVENVSFDDNAIEIATEANILNANDALPTVPQMTFRAGTWAKIKSGRYRGDLGFIVNDDFKEIDTSTHTLLTVVPRIQLPGLSQARPPKAPLPIDFSLSPPIAWASFIASDKVPVTAVCVKQTCSNAWECNHQENCRKRYRLLGQTVRGGFVLLKVKLEALDLALRVADDEFAVFTAIAEGDCLGRVPPLTSWIFQEKETVILRHSRIPAALPGMHWEEDLGRLTDGAEGVIQKVGDLMCEVAFKEKGEVVDVRSVAYRHLVKKLVVGQTVRLGPGVRELREIQWIQRGESGVLSVEERRLELANNEGLISCLFMHPLHGPSVSVWIQALSLIVSLNPNSVVDMSFTLTLSSGNSPHPAFACDSLIPSHTTSCDIRDLSVVERSHWQVSQNNTQNLQNLPPEEYFARNPFRKSGRLPWLGVRVYVRSSEREDRSGWRGEVVDIARDVEDSANYFVLVHWNCSGDQLFDWCNYDNARRADNHGLLHEFTPYSGNSPWKRLRVKVIKKGLYKDCEGEVVDARADPILDHDTVSGISVQIRFHDGDMVGEKRIAWVDYHYVRCCSTWPMRFLHEFGIGDKGLKSYYTFKMGYRPEYSPEEIQRWGRTAIQIPETPTNSPCPMPPPSPYFCFEATWDGSSPPPEVPANFWVLDRRIWKTIGNREIDVARADGIGDLRVSVNHLATGAITLQNHKTRTGSYNQRHEFEDIHPGVIAKNPWSFNIKRSPTANGLYIICNLEPHTGKLARRVRFTKSTSVEKEDRWLLQVVSWTLPVKGMDHIEVLVNEPFITTTRDHLVLVHEALSTVDKANEMMCRLRHEQQAPLNGYTVNEHGQVLKENRRVRQQK